MTILFSRDNAWYKFGTATTVWSQLKKYNTTGTRNDYGIKYFVGNTQTFANSNRVDYRYSILIEAQYMKRYNRATCACFGSNKYNHSFNLADRRQELVKTCDKNDYVVEMTRVGEALSGNAVRVQCSVDYSLAEGRCSQPTVLTTLVRNGRSLDTSQCGGTYVRGDHSSSLSTYSATFTTETADDCIYLLGQSRAVSSVHIDSLKEGSDTVTCLVIDKLNEVYLNSTTDVSALSSGCVWAPSLFAPTILLEPNYVQHWVNIKCAYPTWYEQASDTLCPITEKNSLRGVLRINMTTSSNIRQPNTTQLVSREGDKHRSDLGYFCNDPADGKLLHVRVPYNAFAELVHEAGADVKYQCIMDADHMSEKRPLHSDTLCKIIDHFPAPRPGTSAPTTMNQLHQASPGSVQLPLSVQLTNNMPFIIIVFIIVLLVAMGLVFGILYGLKRSVKKNYIH